MAVLLKTDQAHGDWKDFGISDTPVILLQNPTTDPKTYAYLTVRLKVKLAGIPNRVTLRGFSIYLKAGDSFLLDFTERLSKIPNTLEKAWGYEISLRLHDNHSPITVTTYSVPITTERVLLSQNFYFSQTRPYIFYLPGTGSIKKLIAVPVFVGGSNYSFEIRKESAVIYSASQGTEWDPLGGEIKSALLSIPYENDTFQVWLPDNLDDVINLILIGD
jgi:hypothetical protein